MTAGRPPFADCEKVWVIFPTERSSLSPDEVEQINRLPALLRESARALERELGTGH